MAAKQKKSFRKEYLNDFRHTANGEYVYCGRTYDFVCEDFTLNRYLVYLTGGAALMILLAALPECLPATEMSRSYWTLLPWLFEAIAVFSAAWQAGRILYWHREMRAYVHDAAVKRLPVFALIASIASIAALTAQIVFLLASGSDSGLFVWLRLASSAANGALGLFYTRFARRAVWHAHD